MATAEPFWVHGLAGLGDGAERRVAARHPRWRCTDGPPPADAGYQALVAGRPTYELLAASPALGTLVVPFAGVPAETATLLSGFPGVAVRTVHHTAGPTAELALGLVLAAARSLLPADRAMRAGDWTPRFVPPQPTMVLGGHPATVVGYGEVGRRVARGLAALGMTVRAVRARAREVTEDGTAAVHPAGDLAALVPDSRVVVLAVPSTPDTAGLFGPAEIAALPSPAVLVNVARAAVVAETALYERLRTGEIAAGLDVWWTEATGAGPYAPVAASRLPFHELPNVVLSPHRGGGFSLPEVRELRLAHVERVLVELA